VANGNLKLTTSRTTDYFDEPFVESNDFIEYWPEDIDIDNVKEATDEGIDADAWMYEWETKVSQKQ
jgi:hypothetical protein